MLPIVEESLTSGVTTPRIRHAQNHNDYLDLRIPIKKLTHTSKKYRITAYQQNTHCKAFETIYPFKRTWHGSSI